ncbi:HpcH/HpaI aldolase family protein [Falsiroseomonas oryzae]|uniref:HpcH/HpaI aldolase family protein n=1 Tax=Falsiroseomonas oryzae TaxID=2766473 RepID=UPI0022EB1E60|nr:aldolase/citrate lyase family protein [Roseomonas sp. MO-31]
MTAMTLKARLRETRDALTMQLCTIPSAVVTQALAAAGSDCVVVDLEHGAVDHASAHAMIAATAGTSCAPMARVTANDATMVKRALDLGAEGIMFPLIESARDARDAVASLRYPPDGTRGFGPFIAQSRWRAQMSTYRKAVEEHLVCCLLIETRGAVEDIEAICAVPGVDIIVPAQFDLSTALGVSGQFDHPDFVAAVARVERAATAAGLPLCGVAFSRAQAEALFARGYRMIAGFDVLWLRAQAAEMRSWLAR